MQTLSQIERSYSIRQILSGALLTFEDNSFYYKNTRGGVEKENIPFFYALTGSSKRYVRHHYLREANSGDMIEDVASLPIPRGVIGINDVEVNSEAKTNRFVHVEHDILEDGELKRISSEAEFVPITLNVQGKVVYNSINEMLDSFEYFATKFSERQKYQYMDLGVKISASLYMPSDFSGDIPFEWTFEDRTDLINEFSIQIVSFILKINDQTSRSVGKVINKFKGESVEPQNINREKSVYEKPGGLDSPFNF